MLRNLVWVFGLAIFATACASVPEGEQTTEQTAEEAKKEGKKCRKVREMGSNIPTTICS